MITSPDPAVVLQYAWSVFRLPKLQAVVRATIADLEQIEPLALLGREPSPAEREFTVNPLTTALAVCSDELRCESGITDSGVPNAQRATGTPLWTELFNEALDHYRRAAASRLQASFDESRDAAV